MIRSQCGRCLGSTYQLGEPAITGDTAQIPVTLREAGKEQKTAAQAAPGGRQMGGLRHGRCRIIPDDPDSEIVMNFEEPPEAITEQIFGGKPEDMAKTMAKEMEKRFKRNGERLEGRHGARTKDMAEGKPGPGELAAEALGSISRDQFEAAWKVDLESKGRPAGEVLRDLVKAVGRPFETTPIQDRALAKPVAIEVRGLSRYQAIEEVTCALRVCLLVYSEPVTCRLRRCANSIQATMRLRPRRGPRLARLRRAVPGRGG